MSNPFFNFKTLQKGSKKMVQIIKECYSKTDTLVSPNIQPGFLRSQLPIYPPQQGQDLDSIIDETKKIFHPGVFQWHSQKFFGYYPCITSVVSVIAEMYTTAFHSPNFCYAVGPSFTELENHVVDWSCMALGLPERFLLKSLGGGTINNSTSQSIFSTIHTAKRKKMKQLGIQGNDPRVLKFVGYYGQTAHTSAEKGLSVKDIYYRRSVPYFYNREKLNYFMDQQKLLSMIEQDVKNGLIPFWIGCSYGNTFSAAIDISDHVVSICKKFGMWINVDAAYLGSTWISQKYRPKQKWSEEVDSICINFSKILLNGSGGSLLFIADKKNLMQAFSDDTSNFTFYQNKFNQNYDVTDYKDWSVGLGRRNNSLKLYYTFKHYGIKFIKEAVEKQDQKLHFLHNLIRKHQDLFDVHAIQYSLILFQAKLKNGQNSQKLTRQIGQHIQNISQGFCTPSLSKGLYMLRINICNFHTEQEHILTYFNEIVKISSQLQQKAQLTSP